MGYYHRTLTAAGVLALGMLRAGTDNDPDLVLQQVTEKVLGSVGRARGYMCVETVERAYYRKMSPDLSRKCPPASTEWNELAADLRLASTDRLRMDVILTATGEVYSWPGASHFDGDIDTVVTEGPIASGAFSSLLDVMFATDVKQFHYEGHKLVGGEDRMEYSFSVLQRDSHYPVKAGGDWMTVGYGGSIFVDPAQVEITRLRIYTLDGAPYGVCETQTELDFSLAQAGVPFLLPAQSRQHFLLPGGHEVSNSTRFANCQEYRGESTISFDSPVVPVNGPAAKTPLADRVRIPGGLLFTLELMEPIDTDHAAAGDRFHARLVGALRNARKEVLAANGSAVEGRLLRVQTLELTNDVEVVLAPSAVWIGDERVALAAERDWSKLLKEAADKHRPRPQLWIPLAPEWPAGVVRLNGAHNVLPAGLRLDWRTVWIKGQNPKPKR